MTSPEHYGQAFQDHLLEQYKLYVEMMDRTSARRNQMNSFYTSLLSGLMALLALVTAQETVHAQEIELQILVFLAVAVLGLLLCLVWYFNIRSYKNLNSGKFKVIHELECQLPFPCYDREWEHLKKDKRYRGYWTQTKGESMVPIILAVAYMGLLIYTIGEL